jgi:hypothetical protein
MGSPDAGLVCAQNVDHEGNLRVIADRPSERNSSRSPSFFMGDMAGVSS